MQSTLPSKGEGSLTMREDPKLYGSNKESTLLQPGNAFYKTLARDCTKSHVCVDMFLFGQQYNDVATMSKFILHCCRVRPIYADDLFLFYFRRRTPLHWW
jgi:hypothetical protein